MLPLKSVQATARRKGDAHVRHPMVCTRGLPKVTDVALADTFDLMFDRARTATDALDGTGPYEELDALAARERGSLPSHVYRRSLSP